MDEVHKLSNSEYYTPSSEPIRSTKIGGLPLSVVHLAHPAICQSHLLHFINACGRLGLLLKESYFTNVSEGLATSVLQNYIASYPRS
jgi:hypothetical protein